MSRFISSAWRITSKGMFAGSCIGVVMLVMTLEFLRRLGYEFDNHVAGRPSLFSGPKPRPSAGDYGGDEPLHKPADLGAGSESVRRSPTLLQHTLRSLLHMVQFAVAYFIMLLAMYYNGYFIICILIGAFLGNFVFSWKRQENR
ncbi:hypothetical protein FQN49_005604 [Arthroderma sp. PD_2]|nr:hypothetical protein FQN49_005604 [Arthroderma sp. PD_2]